MSEDRDLYIKTLLETKGTHELYDHYLAIKDDIVWPKRDGVQEMFNDPKARESLNVVIKYTAACEGIKTDE